MPLSRDEQARHRQLANLRRGAGDAGAGVGNSRAVTHGAYARIAEAELEANTKRVFDAIAADAPVRTAADALPAHDGMIVRQLAEALVRRDRVRLTELRHGLEAPNGKLRGVVEYGLRLDAQILEYAKELGMTPRSRAALGLDLARSSRATLDDFIDGTEAG